MDGFLEAFLYRLDIARESHFLGARSLDAHHVQIPTSSAWPTQFKKYAQFVVNKFIVLREKYPLSPWPITYGHGTCDQGPFVNTRLQPNRHALENWFNTILIQF
jgi:hypothetical protein